MKSGVQVSPVTGAKQAVLDQHAELWHSRSLNTIRMQLMHAVQHLDGDTQGAFDGARGLAEDSEMGGAAAPAHSAPSPMEQG